MKVAVLFSGGKDSCLALHLAKKEHEIVCLLNIVPKNFDSFMFHKPNFDLLKRQARELGVKLVMGETLGEEGRELDDLALLIGKVKDDVDGIVVGGIASSYQGKRIKKICDEYGLEFVAPLWDFSSEKVWEELLKNKFEVVMTKIACDGLGRGWLGKVIDKKNLGELKKLSEGHGFRMDFEGGAAETAVLFMPGFKKKIGIEFDVKSEGEYRHWMENVRVK
ncbi:TIGR00289 family protein [Candidatus Pacearchaeota archaeon]|nr:TIGR00289 family protein [Candidatus Pacearchaeota archaeon]|tara:strand:- start:1577 stop:2239 length:663 start_codon:yes stop_codon:yes gene_type:complete